jgi:hypothetical protein
MNFCNIVRRSFLICLVFGYVLSGCGEKSISPLDKDDIRFAGFYSDYLLELGVVTGNEADVLAALDSSQINVLLARHALTRESLNRKVEAYKKSPVLWQSLLVLVRSNLLKKSGAAQ